MCIICGGSYSGTSVYFHTLVHLRTNTFMLRAQDVLLFAVACQLQELTMTFHDESSHSVAGCIGCKFEVSQVHYRRGSRCMSREKEKRSPSGSHIVTILFRSRIADAVREGRRARTSRDCRVRDQCVCESYSMCRRVSHIL